MIEFYDLPSARVLTGLSTNTKPAAPPQGTRFIETDTNAAYIFLGDAWVVATDLSAAGITIVI